MNTIPSKLKHPLMEVSKNKVISKYGHVALNQQVPWTRSNFQGVENETTPYVYSSSALFIENWKNMLFRREILSKSNMYLCI